MGHPEIYTAEYYQRLYELETRHWWHVGMRVVAAALLGSRGEWKSGARVLDAGCGTGASMTWAQERLGARTVIGVDISPEALQLCRSRPGQQVLQGSVLECSHELSHES